MSGKVNNAYCLVRPPGHHAISNKGMGFCIFNNIALTAMYAKTLGIKKIAIVDYDVHWGNGTQEAFWNDPNVLFISLHQDNNYPQGGGKVSEIGGPDALGFTINIPLPPGSGMGAYMYAFQHVVTPAVERFQPELILVSSGFDANYMDPLAAMGLSSEAFGNMAETLVTLAEKLCGGKLIFLHEGGYSKDYVPFCALSVIQKLTGIKLTHVSDPYLQEVSNWGYQDLQPHQKSVIDAVCQIHKLSSTENAEMASTEITTDLTSLKVINEIQTLLQDKKLNHNEQRHVLKRLLSEIE